MMTEQELKALYEEWADSPAHAYETNHYGHERAGFYAGVAAERERIARLAQEQQATYWVGPDDSLAPRRPFALLLRVGPLE